MVMLISQVKQGILQVVAIVRLSGSLKINDRIFHGEVKITMMAQHQNIVRFLGNCSYAAKEEASIHGKTTNAEIRERLLCFEYLSNGSLKKHISGTIKKLSNTYACVFFFQFCTTVLFHLFQFIQSELKKIQMSHHLVYMQFSKHKANIGKITHFIILFLYYFCR